MANATLGPIQRVEFQRRHDILGRQLIRHTRELDRCVEALVEGDRSDVFEVVAGAKSGAGAEIDARRAAVESVAAEQAEYAAILGSAAPAPTAAAIIGAIRANRAGAVLARDPLSLEQKIGLLEEASGQKIETVEVGGRYNVKGLPYIATDFDGFDFDRPTQMAATPEEAIHRAFEQVTEIAPQSQRVTEKAWSWDEERSGTATWRLFDHAQGSWRISDEPPATMLTLG